MFVSANNNESVIFFINWNPILNAAVTLMLSFRDLAAAFAIPSEDVTVSGAALLGLLFIPSEEVTVSGAALLGLFALVSVMVVPSE